MSKKILPGAGPFYFDGNKIGIIIIHGGGGGTCADLKPLAKDLHDKGGYTISVPLLPGYGITKEQLKDTPISAWKGAIDNEIRKLQQNCEKIFLGGHSMGGILTLISASRYNLDGIFTISAPTGIKIFSVKLVPIAKIFMKYHSLPDIDKLIEKTNGKWVGYKKIPLNVVTKVKKLMKEMKKTLPKITCPVLILQGRLDSYIKDSSMDNIFNAINSKIKRKVWLENNEHDILFSPDHNTILSELINFISEI